MTGDQRVQLADSDFEKWARMAEQMTARLQQLVPHAVIEHIGSTSVPDLPAKPVVDIALGVPRDEISHVTRMLVEQGFDLEGEKPLHSWLSTPSRAHRDYVIHVFEYPGRLMHRRLLFRNALRSDLTARSRYLKVKRQAAASSSNWDEYTQAKTDVVHEILENASIRLDNNADD